jgi:hypothetical protein
MNQKYRFDHRSRKQEAKEQKKQKSCAIKLEKK